MQDTGEFRRGLRLLGCAGCPAEGLVRVIADSEPRIFEGRADVLFVGVNPGSQEAREGIPFCGPAGQLLRRIAREVLPGRVLAFTNVMFCSTGNEASIPDPDGCIARCRGNVREACHFFMPKVYVPCGSRAMHEAGVPGSVTANAGKLIDRGKYGIVPCIHPSAVLRGSYSEEAIRGAMRTVAEFLQAKAA